MKKAVKRILIVFLAVLIGLTLVYVLAFLGDQSSGPAENLLKTLNRSLFDLEEEYILKNKSQTRAQRLAGFNVQLRNKDSLLSSKAFLLGAYDNRVDISFQPIIELEDSLRTSLPIIHIYTAWGDKENQQFPENKIRTIAALGSIPLITWEPWLNDFETPDTKPADNIQDPNKGGLRKIAAGQYDLYLRSWAESAKNSGITILLRLGHEMNDPYRYPWGPQNNQPEDFLAAWKHVVSVFREIGADNIVWIWAPHLAYGQMEAFYPGSEWVDWISTGTLNYGTVAPWSQWWSFSDIFGKYYAELEGYQKPILIAEFGSLAVGGNRAAWYADALKNFREEFPSVRGLIFFHHGNDNSTTYQSLDWTIYRDQIVLDSIRRYLPNLQQP